jgi:DNA-binding NtrC family response regulator
MICPVIHGQFTPLIFALNPKFPPEESGKINPPSSQNSGFIHGQNKVRINTSGREGMELLARFVTQDSTLPVVVMTAWGSVSGAVEAMRLGARDYVQKPWDNTRLVATLHSQVELGRALRESRRLERAQAREHAISTPNLIATASAMQTVLHLVERVGPSDAAVLVTGEHGTGKDVIARLLHAHSPRCERTFVPLNAGGISDGVFESELFGHVKGAFTDAKADRVGCFELAHQGTLFLDEIGNMQLTHQAALLRALQTGEYHPVGSSKVRQADVRVIAATNADLGEAVARGEFREDLLYRLNTVEIHLPALRERAEDIVPLASLFLSKQRARYNKPGLELSENALKALWEHPWPGNVRELEHAIERAVLLAQGRAIQPEDLMLKPARSTEATLNELTLEQAERLLIEKALSRSQGNVTQAAQALGMSRTTMYRRIQEIGIKVRE